jgi:hypothetical protein
LDAGLCYWRFDLEEWVMLLGGKSEEFLDLLRSLFRSEFLLKKLPFIRVVPFSELPF